VSAHLRENYHVGIAPRKPTNATLQPRPDVLVEEHSNLQKSCGLDGSFTYCSGHVQYMENYVKILGEDRLDTLKKILNTLVSTN